MVNFRCAMEWLMDVTYVVNYETQRKRPLVFDIWELLSNLVDIHRARFSLK